MLVSPYLDLLVRGDPDRPSTKSLVKWLTDIDVATGAIPKPLQIREASDLTPGSRDTLTIAQVDSKPTHTLQYSTIIFRAVVVAADEVARHLAGRMLTVLNWQLLGITTQLPRVRRLPARLTPGTVHYQIEWGIMCRNDDTNLDDRNPNIAPIVLSIAFVDDESDAFLAADNTVQFEPGGTFAQPYLL